MHFDQYLSKSIIDSYDYIYQHNNSLVLKYGELYKLAVPVTENIYMLFYFNEYSNIKDKEVDHFINIKIKEAKNLFSATLQLVNNKIPNNIYQEVNYISSLYSEPFDDNVNEGEIIESHNILVLRCNFMKSKWGIYLWEKPLYCLDNKNSALRVYELIKKDISKLITCRWLKYE